MNVRQKRREPLAGGSSAQSSDYSMRGEDTAYSSTMQARCACGDPCSGDTCWKCLWWDAHRSATENRVLGADRARTFRDQHTDALPDTGELQRRVTRLELSLHEVERHLANLNGEV